jgi:hypothetical protein
MGRDQVVGSFAAGISILAGERFEIGGRYEGNDGSGTKSRTASIKLGIRF